ncbi:HEAT repeat domain-containing protein [Actinoplanes sp. NPDC089786]|uniref:HEAT repeat domain-containing protein n=1 Tax=Actinoplanes sp. NPDC089786 TaxID=3155185 RepID=UPI00342649D0
MSSEIPRLIRLLADDWTENVGHAKHDLVALGHDVVLPLTAAVPTMRPETQLAAVEVLERLAATDAAPALIALLTSEHTRVRARAAQALGTLRIQPAVPKLQEIYGYADHPATPDAIAIRHALTTLGARQEVIPDLTASLQTTAGTLARCWPMARLKDVINDLADHAQVVLHYQHWSVRDTGTHKGSRRDSNVTFAPATPWPELVESARTAALASIHTPFPRPYHFAVVEWINQSDA